MTTSNDFKLQSIKSKGMMLGLIKQAAIKTKFKKIVVLVAYTTHLGCQTLVTALSQTCTGWNSIEKEWVVSLDFGHTEPKALEYLSNLPHSMVRVAHVKDTFKYKLRPPVRFHPKIYYFLSPKKIAIVSGSCNLTHGGLYTNTEQANLSVFDTKTITPGSPQDVLLNHTVQVIQEVFANSTPLTSAIMKKYQSLWKPKNLPPSEKRSPSRFIAANPSIDFDKALALSTSLNFWIKVTPKVVQNLGPNHPGNQIDMQRGTRVFFGCDVSEVPVNTQLGKIFIKFNNAKTSHSLRYGNNGMDKITLPILASPNTYANKTLLFTKILDGTYTLKIGATRSVTKWRQLSSQQGTAYKMQSGREYGVFD